MTLPDGRPLTVDHGVVIEPATSAGRVVLWVPGGDRSWERVGSVPHAAVTDGGGVRAIAVTSIVARQRPARPLGGLLRRLRRPRADRAWALPGGEAVEVRGTRRVDLVLAWSVDEAVPLDEARVRARWPGCREVRPVGRGLYLVSGVDRGPAVPAPGPSPEPPRALAERALAAARGSGDDGRVVTALADLGIACQKEGDLGRATEAFEGSLAGARRLGDRVREADALGGLGHVLLLQGRPGPALEALGRALAGPGDAGDRYAEKAVLELLGLAHLALGAVAEGLAAFERAAALAGDLGDRHHEAALLWLVALGHAELGRPGRAIASGQAAVDLLRRLGSPRAEWYARHLAGYRPDAPGASLPRPLGPGAFAGATIDAGLAPAAPGADRPGPAGPGPGPGILRMALTATDAMARFIGSGFRTAEPAAYRARVAACSSCEHHTGLRCRLCGCFTDAKARLLHEDCPAGRWPSRDG